MNEKIVVCTSQACKEQLKEYLELKASISKNKEEFEDTLKKHLVKIDDLQRALVTLQQENKRAKQFLAHATGELESYLQKCAEKDQSINELMQKSQA